ncbi:hypothetical protein HNO88_002965 [Novosphingobium chloroacetimidivorans]|uniref:Uncharacterized protein n=1 Tax=Novosphingobium chloroacetimidivorans TaxID=1428314 RepID=A0A7W7KBW3_9SPHN|nr:hypothetical protein [Novosphingobium chloroacetimidivorans]MBB4859636.1 hypothetical protein [Novosphingobium chloroacetimidivorans]
MARDVSVVVRQQKVFHDGNGMNVLLVGDDNAKVEAKDIQMLLDEGVIEDPGSDAVAGAHIGGYADGGEQNGPGDTTFRQPIGEFTGEQERNLAQQSQAAAVAGGASSPSGSEDDSELVELRNRVAELDEECDTLVAERDAALKERDELQRQLDEARQATTIQGTVEQGGAPLSAGTQIGGFDHDGDGTAGGSRPYDPPALTGKNKAELLAIAEAEGVTIEDGATNAAIIEAIEAARAGEDEAPAA